MFSQDRQVKIPIRYIHKTFIYLIILFSLTIGFPVIVTGLLFSRFRAFMGRPDTFILKSSAKTTKQVSLVVKQIILSMVEHVAVNKGKKVCFTSHRL